MRLTFEDHGQIASAARLDDLIGVTDLEVVQTASGTFLLATTRGGGALSVFELGASDGQITHDTTEALPGLTAQLQSTDIAVRTTGANTFQVTLAGLNTSGMWLYTANSAGSGDVITGQSVQTAGSLNAALVAEMAVWEDGSMGLTALSTGGLVQIDYAQNGAMTTRSVGPGTGLQNEVATNIVTLSTGAQDVAVISFGNADVVAIYRTNGNGQLSVRAIVDDDDGLWIDRPTAMTVAAAPDGKSYVVVASAGSSSLSVLEVSANGLTLTPVDHIIDSLGTRFDNASHVTTVTLNGMSYVIAAGTDSGLSVFVLLNGGRLQHVQSIPGSLASPLRNITDVEAVATPDGARIFVSTQGAPYLTELSFILDAPGQTLGPPNGGGTATGSTGDDIIQGGSGNDWLRGQAGDDIIVDGAGADTLTGGNGTDLFVISDDDATDVIEDFNPAFDVIDISTLSLAGGLDDIIVLSRSWGAELRFETHVIEVRSFDNSPLTGADFTAEMLITSGRPPVDPAVYTDVVGDPVDDPSPDPPDISTRPGATRLPGPEPDAPDRLPTPLFSIVRSLASEIGSPNDEAFTGGDGNDFILGQGGQDTIIGNGGRDTLTGDAGSDRLDGGGNNDLLFGGDGVDTLLGGGGNDTVVGDNGADSLRGGGGSDVLLGGGGFDNVYGDGGNDTMWSGAAADRLYGGSGHDWMSAGTNLGSTVDGLWGEGGNDTMFGDGGFDYLDGGTGNDVLDGGNQADNLFGRAGQDTLFGADGRDRLFGGSDDDQLLGGEGQDGHFGEGGNDTAWGGAGDDRFYGGQGDDILLGEAGQDTLYGDAGFDTLDGGGGDDLMFGRFNADRFFFKNGHGHDTIGDFEATNDNERIDLAYLDSFDTMLQVMAQARQVGQDVIIDTSNTSSIRLVGVQLSDLDASDFVL